MQIYDSISLLEEEILIAISSPSIVVSQLNHLKFNDVPDEFAKQELVTSCLESNEEDLDEALINKMFFSRKPEAPSPAIRLAASDFAPFDSEFEQRLHERRAVIAALRQRFVRTKERLAMGQGPVKGLSVEASPVPVMVRLGVLTLFPMVQELKDVQGLNYQRLCRRTLDVIISVLASSGPLGLAREPRDCVDAFADFIGQQMEACQYAIENEEQAQILVAMIGLAVSRGGSSHMLRVVDCLFKVFTRSRSQSVGSEKQNEDKLDIEEHPLDIMTFLAHLKSVDELNSILPCYFDESWFLDTLADLSFVAKTSLALDGSYLYLFNSEAGFVKIGTGHEETLRGFVYNRRSLSDAIPTFLAENAATQSNITIAIGPDALFLFTASTQSEKDKKENWDNDRTRHSLRIIDKTTLRESGRVFLKSSSGGGDAASGRGEEKEHVRLVSCGNFVYLISRAVEVTAAQAAANESSDLLSAALTRFEQLRDQLMQMGTLGEAILEENGIGLAGAEAQIEKDQSSDNSSSEDSASFDSDEEKPVKLKEPVQYLSAKQLIPMLGLQRRSKVVYLVECYDVSHLENGLELEPCKTVTLAQNELIPSENILAPNALEEAEFYTNGSELVCLMNARAPTSPLPLTLSGKLNEPASNANDLDPWNCRVFSLADGKMLKNGSISLNLSPANPFAFCAQDERIWAFDTRRRVLFTWRSTTRPELAPMLQRTADRLDAKADRYLAAPHELEANRQEFQFTSLEAIVYVMVHLDKLARQHHIYTQATIIDSQAALNRYDARQSEQFATDTDPKVFELLYSIIARVLETLNRPRSDADGSIAFTLLACLRLLKLNIYAFVCLDTLSLHKAFEKAGYKDGGADLLANFKSLLLQILRLEPADFVAVSQSTRDDIQLEAARTFTSCFLVFCKTPTEAAQFLIQLFDDARENAGLSVLLATLSSELARYPGLARLLWEDSRVTTLLEGPKDAPVTSSASNSSSKPVVGFNLGEQKPATEQDRQARPHALARRLLQVLVDRLREDAEAVIARLGETVIAEDASHPLQLSPALRLLLALQREITSEGLGRAFFGEYAAIVLEACNALLAKLSEGQMASIDARVLECLRGTLVGVPLTLFVTSLLQKNVYSDAPFMTGLMDALSHLYHVVDQINNASKEACAEGKHYLALQSRPRRKSVVDVSHASNIFSHGVHSYKETVNMRSATSLSLHFDLDCSTNTEALHLLTLAAPVATQPSSQGQSATNAPSSTFPTATSHVPTPLIGSDGRVMSFSGRNFPRLPLRIPGDTVTFVLERAKHAARDGDGFGTRAGKHSTAAQHAISLANLMPAIGLGMPWRWRCVVYECFETESSVTNWLLDLELSVASVCAKAVSCLISADQTVRSDPLAAHQAFQNGLLDGGLEDNRVTGKEWLSLFVEEPGHIHSLFYDWLKSADILRRNNDQTHPAIQRLERAFIAAALKHLRLTAIVERDWTGLETKQALETALSPHAPVLRAIFRKACEVSQWVRVRSQIERRWIEAVTEGSLEDFAGNEGNLKLLCELRGVKFRKDSEHEVLQQLRAKMNLEREKLNPSATNSNAMEDTSQARLAQCYETLVGPLMERLAFLLQRVMPSQKQLDGDDEIGPDELEENEKKAASNEEDFDSPESFEARVDNLVRWERKWRKRYLRHQVKSAASLQAKQKRSVMSVASGVKATLSLAAQAKLSAIASFALSTQSTPSSASSSIGVIEVEALMVKQQQLAVMRCKGYALLQQLLSNVEGKKAAEMEIEEKDNLDILDEELARANDSAGSAFEIVLQQVLVNNSQALFNSRHHFDQLGSCRAEQKTLLQSLFATLFCRLSGILQQSDVTLPTKQLALKVCAHPFCLDDVPLLERSGILGILNALCAKATQLPTTGEQLKPVELEIGDAGGKKKDEMDIEQQGMDVESDKAKVQEEEEATEEHSQAIFRSAAWSCFRHIALTCLALSQALPKQRLADMVDASNNNANSSNNNNSGHNNKKPSPPPNSNRHILHSLLALIFDLLRKDIESLSQSLAITPPSEPSRNKSHITSPVGATYRQAENEKLNQLLSLLYLLCDSLLVRRLLSRPEHVRLLMGFLGQAAWPHTQRLVLRLLRLLLPLQTDREIMRDSLALLLTQFGRLQSFQQAPKSPSLMKKKSTLSSLLSPPPSQPQSQQQQQPLPAPVAKPVDEPCYVVWLHEWSLNEKKLLEVCQATIGANFQPGQTTSLPSSHAQSGFNAPPSTETLNAKIKAIIQSLTETGAAILTTLASKDQASRLAQALAAQGGGAAVVARAADAGGSDAGTGDHASSRNERSVWPLYWMDGQTAYALGAEYVELMRFVLRYAVAQATKDREDQEEKAVSEAPQPIAKKAKQFVLGSQFTTPLSPSALWLSEFAEALGASCSCLPALLENSLPGAGIAPSDALSRALAALDVMGAFDEPLRPGVTVVKTKPAFPMWHRIGTIKQYTLGAGQALVRFDDREDDNNPDGATSNQPQQIRKDEGSGKQQKSATKSPKTSERDEWVAVYKMTALSEYYPTPPEDGESFGGGHDHVHFDVRSLMPHSLIVSVLDSKLGQSLSSDRLLFKTLHCLLDMLRSTPYASRPRAFASLLTERLMDRLAVLAEKADILPGTLGIRRLIQQSEWMHWDQAAQASLKTHNQFAHLEIDLDEAEARGSNALPYACHPRQAERMPTCFGVWRVPGCVFTEDATAVECLTVPAQGRSSRSGGYRSLGLGGMAASSQEVILSGNLALPLELEYYFEMTIEKANSDALISIGFTVGIINRWDSGSISYRYQGNKYKTWYTANKGRRSESYGQAYRHKDVVGCGWNPESKSIYFTKNGVHLGIAFQGALLAGKVYPVIALSKGVKITVNFGQLPFYYAIKPNRDMDETEFLAKQKEAEQYQAAQLALEARAQEAERERVRRARLKAGEPLLQMGYTERQVLLALETTEDNVQAAVFWLLENPQPPEPKEAPQEVSSKEQPPTATKDLTAAKEAPQPSDKEADGGAAKEHVRSPQDYTGTESSQFILSSAFEFPQTWRPKEPSKAAKSALAEWEVSVIPELRAFMETNRYSDLEIREYIQGVRNELSNDNVVEATKMYRHIMGERVPIKTHGHAGHEAQTAAPILQVDGIQRGDMLLVRRDLNLDELSVEAARHWVDAMQATMGRAGFVQTVDRSAKLVLLRFYDAAKGVREEYWYHASLLSAIQSGEPAAHDAGGFNAMARTQKRQSLDKLTKRLMALYGEAVALLAHHILATLRTAGSMPPREEEAKDSKKKSTKNRSTSISFGASLNLLNADSSPLLQSRTHPSEEFLRTCYLPSLLHVFTDAPSALSSFASVSGRGPFSVSRDFLEQLRGWWFAQTIKVHKESERSKLFALDETANSTHSRLPFLHECLVPIIQRALVEEASLCTKAITVENDQAKIGFPSQVSIAGADCLWVVFQRNLTSFPANHAASLCFFSDKKCTKPLHVFGDTGELKSVVVVGNSFYHVMTTQAEQAKCKYAFTVVPFKYKLTQALWLFNFMNNYCFDTPHCAERTVYHCRGNHGPQKPGHGESKSILDGVSLCSFESEARATVDIARAHSHVHPPPLAADAVSGLIDAAVNLLLLSLAPTSHTTALCNLLSHLVYNLRCDPEYSVRGSLPLGIPVKQFKLETLLLQSLDLKSARLPSQYLQALMGYETMGLMAAFNAKFFEKGEYNVFEDLPKEGGRDDTVKMIVEEKKVTSEPKIVEQEEKSGEIELNSFDESILSKLVVPEPSQTEEKATGMKLQDDEALDVEEADGNLDDSDDDLDEGDDEDMMRAIRLSLSGQANDESENVDNEKNNLNAGDGNNEMNVDANQNPEEKEALPVAASNASAPAEEMEIEARPSSARESSPDNARTPASGGEHEDASVDEQEREQSSNLCLRDLAEYLDYFESLEYNLPTHEADSTKPLTTPTSSASVSSNNSNNSALAPSQSLLSAAHLLRHNQVHSVISAVRLYQRSRARLRLRNRDMILKRVVLVENLPTISPCNEAAMTWILNFFRALVPVVEGTFYLPRHWFGSGHDDDEDEALVPCNKTWCVFEVPCAELLPKLSAKLQTVRMAPPPQFQSAKEREMEQNPAYVLTSGPLSHDYDKTGRYYHHLMMDDEGLEMRPKVRALLEDVFVQVTGSREALMDCKKFNVLQKAVAGSEDNGLFDYLYDMYCLTPDQDKDENENFEGSELSGTNKTSFTESTTDSATTNEKDKQESTTAASSTSLAHSTDETDRSKKRERDQGELEANPRSTKVSKVAEAETEEQQNERVETMDEEQQPNQPVAKKKIRLPVEEAAEEPVLKKRTRGDEEVPEQKDLEGKRRKVATNETSDASIGSIGVALASEGKESRAEKKDEVKGFTLAQFLLIYADQVSDDSHATMYEINALGYDMHFDPCFFVDPLGEFPANGVMSLSPHTPTQPNSPPRASLAAMQQLLAYAEDVFAGLAVVATPIDLDASHIVARPSGMLYPLIADLPLRELRLKFEILRHFNSLVEKAIAFVEVDGCSVLARQIRRVKHLIFHAVKMKYFYDVLDKTSVEGVQPNVTLNRFNLTGPLQQDESISAASPMPHFPLPSFGSQPLNADPAKSPRGEANAAADDEDFMPRTAFGAAYRQLRALDPKLFRQRKPPGNNPHYALNVLFEGEHVEGVGGPYRQFFTDVSRELKQCDLFQKSPNAVAGHGPHQDKLILRPCFAISKLRLGYCRFVGRLMGMAVRTGVMLAVDFPPLFWKLLIDDKLEVSDCKGFDIRFFEQLELMRQAQTEEAFAALDLMSDVFEVMMSDGSVRILKDGGSKLPVTFANKDEWVTLAAEARLNESAVLLLAIRRGLVDVIPASILSLCTYQDLEWKVCGKPEIDIDLLKRNTQYSGGLSVSSPHIVFFWQVLTALTQEERRKFIRFAWAQDRLPADDQEFARTSTRMLIKPYTGTANPDQVFIKADTCFFNLTVPDYSTADILKERLLVAIHTDSDSMNADNPAPNTMRAGSGQARGSPRGLGGLPSASTVISSSFAPMFFEQIFAPDGANANLLPGSGSAPSRAARVRSSSGGGF